MTEPKPDQAAIAAAESLTTALQGMRGELKAVNDRSEERDKNLARYGRRNRAVIFVDIVLTVGLALSGGVAVHAAQKASSADSAQLALCQSSNVARAQQIDLWNFLLSLEPAKHQTAAQKKVIAAFEVHLHQIFKPRDCSHLGQN